MNLSGRGAVVTGGGRGIGAAVARRLATHGASVVVCARTASEVESVALGQGLVDHLDDLRPDQLVHLKFGQLVGLADVLIVLALDLLLNLREVLAGVGDVFRGGDRSRLGGRALLDDLEGPGIGIGVLLFLILRLVRRVVCFTAVRPACRGHGLGVHGVADPDDSGGGDDETPLENRPASLEEALKQLHDLSQKLNASMGKTSRRVVSTAVIGETSDIIELVKIIRTYVE